MKTYLLTVLLCTVILYGCKDSTNINTSGASLVGNLKGEIIMYDQNGYLIQNMSGVLVSIEGTSFSALSDSAGHWVIHNLPTTTYSISFTKEGYDTMKITSYTFVGGGTQWINDVHLSQHPTFETSLDAATFSYRDTVIDYYTIFGHIVNNNLGRVRLVFSATTSFKPYEISDRAFYRDVFLNVGETFQEAISSGYLNSLAFGKSDTLYVTSYPLSMPQRYFDVQTEKYVYSGLGKQSNILQIIKK